MSHCVSGLFALVIQIPSVPFASLGSDTNKYLPHSMAAYGLLLELSTSHTSLRAAEDKAARCVLKICLK